MDLDPSWIRVSHVLSILPSQEGDKWAFPMQQIDREVLQRKCDLGTTVHTMIAADLEGIFSYCTNEIYAGYMESYQKWKNIIHPNPVHIEKRFYYKPMNLTGCADVLIERVETGLTLVDFKTSAQEDPKKWPLQAAFYKFLAEQAGLKIDTHVNFVQLDKNGGIPKIHEYIITKDLMQTAISLYNVYIYLTKKQR